jgi:hypothetical protein
MMDPNVESLISDQLAALHGHWYRKSPSAARTHIAGGHEPAGPQHRPVHARVPDRRLGHHVETHHVVVQVPADHRAGRQQHHVPRAGRAHIGQQARHVGVARQEEDRVDADERRPQASAIGEIARNDLGSRWDTFG